MKPYLLFFLLLLGSKSWAQPSLAQASAFAHQHQPAFEVNKGQIWNHHNQPANEVQYHYRKKGLELFLLPTGLAYQFSKVHHPVGQDETGREEDVLNQFEVETYRMDMTLVGAHPNPTIAAEGKSQDYVQYYNRNALNVHSFKKLTYQSVYPGIDWVIYTTQKGLKYDFVVHPGADPQQIQLAFTHHEGLQLNPDGSLTLSNRMGSVTEQAPVSFQGTEVVKTRFVLKGNRLSFEVGDYSSNETLVIDPTLLWATYYGGIDADNGRACTTDANGNVYLSGLTESTANIAAGGHQTSYVGGGDAFLVKFNSSGVRQWATYYGGTGREGGEHCAVYANGNIYLCGTTRSATNMAFNGHQDTLLGFSGAYLVQFNSNGVRQWATYYGGTGIDYGEHCAVDPNGNVYLCGRGSSTTDIAFNGHQDTFGGGSIDAYLVKFNSNGVRQWATYYGGNSSDEGYSCTTDTSGHVYLAGTTGSSSNIASGGHQNALGGFADAFLVQFNSNGVRQWATYYGGTRLENGLDCATTLGGDIYLTGLTESTNGIAFNGRQNTFGGRQDAYLVKFNRSGVRQWATYYGGNSFDRANGCATDANDNVYLAGGTNSTNNMAAGGHQNTYGGNFDAYLVKLNGNGVRQWATYYGGTDQESGHDCAVGPNGDVYLAGDTRSNTGIAVGGHQMTNSGGTEGFLAKFSGAPVVGTTTLPTLPNITLYPNPTTGQLTIDLGELQTASINIYSLSGQLLGHQADLQGPIQQLELPQMPGMYVLEIETEQGISYHQVIKKAP